MKRVEALTRVWDNSQMNQGEIIAFSYAIIFFLHQSSKHTHSQTDTHFTATLEDKVVAATKLSKLR